MAAGDGGAGRKRVACNSRRFTPCPGRGGRGAGSTGGGCPRSPPGVAAASLTAGPSPLLRCGGARENCPCASAGPPGDTERGCRAPPPCAVAEGDPLQPPLGSPRGFSLLLPRCWWHWSCPHNAVARLQRCGQLGLGCSGAALSRQAPKEMLSPRRLLRGFRTLWNAMGSVMNRTHIKWMALRCHPAIPGQAGRCGGEDGCSWGVPAAPRACAGSRGGSFTNCIRPPPRTGTQMTAPGCRVLLIGTAHPGAERRVSGPGLKGQQQKQAPWGDRGRNFSPSPAVNPRQHRDWLVVP